MSREPTGQLGLFHSEDPLVEEHHSAAVLAERLPPRLYMGTSSWTYPGWAGVVYPSLRSEAELARDGLVDYVRHPLLTTVGVDRGYYAPIPARDFQRYASQVPAGFRCCLKAPARVTSAIVPGSDRVGPTRENPDFLSVRRFLDEMGDALVEHFIDHTAMVIFELPAVPTSFRADTGRFCAMLDAFLEAMPTGIRCAVELRDPALFTREYARVLGRNRAAHVYNHWSAMPSLRQQSTRWFVEHQPFVVLRLLMPQGARYDDRKRALEPFDMLRAPDPAMREVVVELVKRALSHDREAWVLVSNKAEGCAPRTVRALAEMLTT